MPRDHDDQLRRRQTTLASTGSNNNRSAGKRSRDSTVSESREHSSRGPSTGHDALVNLFGRGDKERGTKRNASAEAHRASRFFDDDGMDIEGGVEATIRARKAANSSDRGARQRQRYYDTSTSPGHTEDLFEVGSSGSGLKVVEDVAKADDDHAHEHGRPRSSPVTSKKEKPPSKKNAGQVSPPTPKPPPSRSWDSASFPPWVPAGAAYTFPEELRSASRGVPSAVPAHNHLRHLHDEVLDFLDLISPKEVSDIGPRRKAFTDLQDLLCFPAAHHDTRSRSRLFVFGSAATGLALPGSDLDVTLLDMSSRQNPGATSDKNRFNTTVNALRRSNLFRNVNRIAHARIPIVKCTHAPSGIPVDISFVADGLSTTSFLVKTLSHKGGADVDGIADGDGVKDPLEGCVTARLHLARPLILLLKQFLADRQLNDASVGGLGSFPVALMVIAFLQQTASVSDGHRTEAKSSCTKEGQKKVRDSSPPSSRRRKTKGAPVSGTGGFYDEPADALDVSCPRSVDFRDQPTDEEDSSTFPFSGGVDDSGVDWEKLQRGYVPHEINTNLGYLLIRLLHFYGWEFDFEEWGLDIRGTGCRFKKSRSTALFIKNPLEPSRNACSACSTFGTSVHPRLRLAYYWLVAPLVQPATARSATNAPSRIQWKSESIGLRPTLLSRIIDFNQQFISRRRQVDNERSPKRQVRHRDDRQHSNEHGQTDHKPKGSQSPTMGMLYKGHYAPKPLQL